MIISPAIRWKGKIFVGDDHMKIYNDNTTEKPLEKAYQFDQFFFTDEGALLTPEDALMHAIECGMRLPKRAILLSGTLPANIPNFKYDLEAAQKFADALNSKGKLVPTRAKAKLHDFNEIIAFYHKTTPEDVRENLKDEI